MYSDAHLCEKYPSNLWILDLDFLETNEWVVDWDLSIIIAVEISYIDILNREILDEIFTIRLVINDQNINNI